MIGRLLPALAALAATLLPALPAAAAPGRSDFAVSVTNPSGRVGEVVTARFTVRNLGPDVQPSWGFSDLVLPRNVQLIGVDGCRRGVLQGSRVECAFTTPLPVGQSRTISVRMRIVAEPVNEKGGFEVFWFANADPDRANNHDYFEVNVVGAKAVEATAKPSPKRSVSPAPIKASVSKAQPARAAEGAPTGAAGSPEFVAVVKRHTPDMRLLVGPGVNAGVAVLLLMLGTLAGRRLRR